MATWLSLADALAAVHALGQLLDVVGVVALVHVAQRHVAQQEEADVVRARRLREGGKTWPMKLIAISTKKLRPNNAHRQSILTLKILF
jgi:hypothetical protein